MKRRNYLRNAALVAGTLACKSSVFGASGANEKIRYAVVGTKMMGNWNTRDALAVPNTECVAVCDVDSLFAGKLADFCLKTSGVRPDICGDYRKLIDRSDIDAVIVATPDHWHCKIFCDACAAGKDVYVEKPIANSVAECDIMVKTAKKYRRVVSVGQQQNSSKMWREVIDFVKSGKLGNVGRVDVWANYLYGAGKPRVPDQQPPSELDYDMWLGPSPKEPYNVNRTHGLWRLFWNHGGGLMTDWGVHLLDMVLQSFEIKGLPESVCGVGGKFGCPEMDSQTFDTLNVVYKFSDKSIAWSNSPSQVGFYNRNYGIAWNGQNGVLVANRSGWEVIPVQKRIEKFSAKPSNNEHAEHIENFFNSMRARRFDTSCTIENGALCAKYAHLGNIAARTGKILRYDDAKKTFGDTVADALLCPTYRAPWTFPQA